MRPKQPQEVCTSGCSNAYSPSSRWKKGAWCLVACSRHDSVSHKSLRYALPPYYFQSLQPPQCNTSSSAPPNKASCHSPHPLLPLRRAAAAMAPPRTLALLLPLLLAASVAGSQETGFMVNNIRQALDGLSGEY